MNIFTRLVEKDSVVEKAPLLKFTFFAHLYCLEDYACEKAENSKRNVRMHSIAMSNWRLCESNYNEA